MTLSGLLQGLNVQTASAFAVAAVALVAAGVTLYVGRRQSKAAIRQAEAAIRQAEAANKQAEAAVISARSALLNTENSGRHAVAVFRQKWIDSLRDVVAEYHSILMSISEYPYPEDKDRELSQLGTKIELLLNPTEDRSRDLLQVMYAMYGCKDLKKRGEMDSKLVSAAQAILKTEWDRVKLELQRYT